MSCQIDFIKDWQLKYQGAESRLYFGMHSNNRCVIKHRFSKKYRHPLLDMKLTKERTKRERRIVEKIRTKSNELSLYMPRIVWSNESTLLMTEITDCETIFDYINHEPQEATSVASLIGDCIATLHNLGIIHGDLTTSNLLLLPRIKNGDDDRLTATPVKTVRSSCTRNSHIVIPIDFGLSTGSNHSEERAVDLYVLERALLSTHFSDSTFFNMVLDAYLSKLDDSTCEPAADKTKVTERLKEVRTRGRKSDYSSDVEG